jgi:hypothetical protein
MKPPHRKIGKRIMTFGEGKNVGEKKEQY